MPNAIGVPEEAVLKGKCVGELLAQRVRKPEDDGDQQPIAELVDLDNELSLLSRHQNTHTFHTSGSPHTQQPVCRSLPLLFDKGGVNILNKPRQQSSWRQLPNWRSPPLSSYRTGTRIKM